MNNLSIEIKKALEQTFYLSDLLGGRVYLRKRRLGSLEDFLIVDKDKFAEATHLCVGQPFGRPTIYVPWEMVTSFSGKEVIIDIDRIEPFTGEPAPSSVLLKDHILDKKVLDIDDRELEVVYDVKLSLKNGKLYVIEVDLSRYSLLRRIGLRWLADLIYRSNEKTRDNTVPWSLIEPLPEHLGSFKGDLKLKILKEQFAQIPPVDLADILEELDHEQRMAIFDGLENGHASDTLEELDPSVQRPLVASLQKEKVARLIDDMTPGQAADLLAVLPLSETEAIIKLLDKENSTKIQAILEQQESRIVDLAVPEYLSFPPDMTIQEARAEFKRRAMGKGHIGYIYVLGQDAKLLGVLDLRELLMADDESTLKDVMTPTVIDLNPQNTLKEAHQMFARYNLRALPVVDENGSMLGVLPYRDVVNLRHRFLE
ncbi:MAG TPA: CBS domain-containing protein [Acidobacteriota bacterium]|nr:CBS domain-containing protein [Acidobacteriota bacterium]